MPTEQGFKLKTLPFQRSIDTIYYELWNHEHFKNSH